jgi:hypothetical protein
VGWRKAADLVDGAGQQVDEAEDRRGAVRRIAGLAAGRGVVGLQKALEADRGSRGEQLEL